MHLRSGLVVPSPHGIIHSQALGVPGIPAPSAQPLGAVSASGVPDPAQREAAFREGVRLCLRRWTALQLAIENGWGGRHSRQKAQELSDNILAWFAARAHKRAADDTPRFYADELEDFLDEAVLQSFNMEVEDGSLEEVSKAMMQAHEECHVGNFTAVLQWQQAELEQQQKGRGAAAESRKQPGAQGEESDSDESMDEDGDATMGGDDASEQQKQGNTGSGAPPGGMALEGVAQEQGQGQLSQQEADDGWQQVPSRRSGRRR